MKLPVHIEVAPSGTAAEKVSQELFIVKKEDKKRILGKILEQYKGSVLLFSRTKIGAKKIASMLRNMGHRSAEIHSDRTLGQRKEALEGFKRGRYRILVATDIAARGIDVTGIELVINYDLPDDTENYVHRIGRTGRAGQEGRAISFATPEQGNDVRNIERLIKTPLPIVQHPEIPVEKFIVAAKKGGGRRPFRSGRRKVSESSKRRIRR
jgi:ATP-dependent RNA helicase RhlE